MATATSRRRQAESGTDIVEREPPFDLDAERGVIGSCLLAPDAIDECTLRISERDFYDSAHACLFRHIVTIHEKGKPLDPTLLRDALNKAGELELIGGSAYIFKLFNAVPNHAHAPYYADLVLDASGKRRVISAAANILSEAYHPGVEATDLIARAEAQVFAISEDRSTLNSEIDFRAFVHEVLESVRDRSAGKATRGVKTGFHQLDKVTGGMMPGELTILAGRTSMGKTACAMNIAASVSKTSKVPVVFFSLEMNAMTLGERLLSMESRVDLYRMRHQLNQDERESLVEAACRISEMQLRVDDSAFRSLSEIGACCRRIKRKHGLSLVIVDYLQLVHPDNTRDPRHEQVARISRQMKGLARELNVPILCLAQLNREPTKRTDARPRLSDLRESGAIEQDADVVLFCHRPDYYTQTALPASGQSEKAVLIIAKQRQGPTGDVPVLWFGSYTSYANPAIETDEERFQPKRVAEFDEYNKPGPRF